MTAIEANTDRAGASTTAASTTAASTTAAPTTAAPTTAAPTTAAPTTAAPTARTLTASAPSPKADPARTRALLACGVAATPLFAVVSLGQAFTREGFDLLRHPLSMLSTGDLGWLQIANFLISGVLTIAGAIGLREAMRGTPGGTWAPRLILVNGIGMLAAGVFVMDPGDGFPAGTPLGQTGTLSTSGLLHMVSGSIAFTALIAACFVLGRHFSRTGRRRHAVASRLAGLVFAAGDLWAMSGGRAGSLTLCVGVLTAMTLVAATAAGKRSEVTG